jgi:ATP-dependent DNA helicase RecG
MLTICNLDEIGQLIQQLETTPADGLENQHLDFKEWINDSLKLAVQQVVEMAVCMANGGGGTVVFGVNDKAVGRSRAIRGIPPEINVNLLKKAVYDSTDPKLTPHFEELFVPEGTCRLLVMHILPGIPPHTTTSGVAKIRIGKDCQPLTGSMRRRIMVETGEFDPTSQEIPGNPETHISASAMEQLREAARQERAPEDLLQMNDLQLLSNLGVLHNGHLTRAGLLIGGKDESIREHVPGYVWTYLQMDSETSYINRLDGHQSIPIALARLTDKIMANNQLTTVEYGAFHFEYRTYPEIALREALMNAFCHADYRMGGPLLIKHYPQKLEISNPGGLIGGISPQNILHHPPVPRNPHLVDALIRLRLVNRGNLGIPRMFKYMLLEGKEPPIIEDEGDTVKITFYAGDLSVPFRSFVAEEGKKGFGLTVDNLLILQYLLRHTELDTQGAMRICQRNEVEAREILSKMEKDLGYLQRGGTGRGTYWVLHPEVHRKLSAIYKSKSSPRIEWDVAKISVLNILKKRCNDKENGLTNSEIRQRTRMDRNQVKRLMAELRTEGQVFLQGAGRGAVWICSGAVNRRQ